MSFKYIILQTTRRLVHECNVSFVQAHAVLANPNPRSSPALHSPPPSLRIRPTLTLSPPSSGCTDDAATRLHRCVSSSGRDCPQSAGRPAQQDGPVQRGTVNSTLSPTTNTLALDDQHHAHDTCRSGMKSTASSQHSSIIDE